MQNRRCPRAASQPQKESLRDHPAGMSASFPSSASSASSSFSVVSSPHLADTCRASPPSTPSRHAGSTLRPNPSTRSAQRMASARPFPLSERACRRSPSCAADAETQRCWRSHRAGRYMHCMIVRLAPQPGCSGGRVCYAERCAQRVEIAEIAMAVFTVTDPCRWNGRALGRSRHATPRHTTPSASDKLVHGGI
jgi:hypothetical protein